MATALAAQGSLTGSHIVTGTTASFRLLTSPARLADMIIELIIDETTGQSLTRAAGPDRSPL